MYEGGDEAHISYRRSIELTGNGVHFLKLHILLSGTPVLGAQGGDLVT